MWTSLPHFKRESLHQSAPVSPVDAAARISSEEKEVLNRDLLTSPVRGTDLLIWSKSLSSRFRHRRLEDRAAGRLGTTPLSSGISSGKENIFYQNKQIPSPVLLILPSLARPLCGTPGLEDLRGIFFSEKLPMILYRVVLFCSARISMLKRKTLFNQQGLLCTSRISWNRISDWLPIVFHFGTENWEEQLKKHSV